MIRVVLVDDQPDFRKIIRRILSLHADIEVVGEANNGAEALEVVAQVRPDVVLMDVQMPILDGVATTRRMHESLPDLPIILFTTFDHDNYVFEGMKVGAVGYLLKTVHKEALVAAIRLASEGRSIEPEHNTPAGRPSSRQRG